MANLGFLGLGIMGGPMAQHLIAGGHNVALWSFTKGKAEKLAGGTPCATPAEVGAKSDVIFLCVGDTEMSREVIFGENGIVKGAKPGTIILECSTISPSESQKMGAELAKLGFKYLDAPITGSKAGAEGASLTIMVGGDRELYDSVMPYLQLMGKQFYYCGTLGMGMHAKLSQNLIVGNLLQAFNESFVLSTKAGVDPEVMLDILNNSAARSGLVAIKAPLVFKRDFTTNFSVKWLEKDIGLIVDSGEQLGVPTPMTKTARKQLITAIEKGFGEEDIAGSIRVLEEEAGCIVKTEKA